MVFKENSILIFSFYYFQSDFNEFQLERIIRQQYDTMEYMAVCWGTPTYQSPMHIGPMKYEVKASEPIDNIIKIITKAIKGES